MISYKENLKSVDAEVYEAILNEESREEGTLELIASENAVSRAVLEAQGSLFTNKYAEGYPGKRYYGGCEFVDVVEDLARERAKKLFGAKFANVQPHSGSQANMAVYMSVLTPSDTILGLGLPTGGHLTHGSKVNFSGKIYNAIEYGVDEKTGLIDMEEVRKLAIQHQPKMIVTGASAYSRVIDFEAFRAIADEVGAYFMVDMAHIAGLVAAGEHPSPMEHAHFVTTTTHKTLRGPRGGMILTNDEELSKKINKTIFPGIQGGPLAHVMAAKAVAFKEALSDEFKSYQKQVRLNATSLAEALIQKGFSIVSGGTDNHLLLMDFSDREFTGKDAEHALEAAGMTTNKNTVPGEKRSPFVTSGVRIGTPTITTRGMKEAEMLELADMISTVLNAINDEKTLNSVKEKAENLCKRFPLYK